MTELTGRYVDVLGYRTYYETVGAGSAVVCIHTAGADGREYRHLLPHLASAGWQGIALDMPGHGKSYPALETLRPIDTAEEWVDFILAFSEEVGLERPVYVGGAMSASLLLRLASDYPSATRGIVAAGAMTNGVGTISTEFLDVLNHPLVNLSDFMESTTLGLCGPLRPLVSQNECVWHNARNLTPEVMEADLRMYSTHNIDSTVGRIAVPVLHLRGEFDRLLSDDMAAAVRSGVPDVTMVDLPGVGHFPMLEDPDLFNRTVEAFLQMIKS